jgi:hypothetical protein
MMESYSPFCVTAKATKLIGLIVEFREIGGWV